MFVQNLLWVDIATATINSKMTMSIYLCLLTFSALNHAQYINLFVNNMGSPLGWVIEGSALEENTNCLIDDCVSVTGGSSITYNGISTDGYHSIHIQSAVTPHGFENGNGEYCQVLYSVDGTNFQELKRYDESYENILQNDVD